LTDAYANSLVGEEVVFSYTFSGIADWIPMTSELTDENGRFEVTWVPQATGYFVVKAEWVGNETHSEAINTTTLSSTPYNNQYIFTVESNSTISGLAFDSDKWKLSFSATGESGTRGYVRVTIAKSLVSEPTEIKVYQDESQLTYSIVSLEDAWLLTFEYTHSTHQFTVDLGTSPVIPDNYPYIADV
jgi:hypothetical protein